MQMINSSTYVSLLSLLANEVIVKLTDIIKKYNSIHSTTN